ncbi:hypothetical protein RHOSPDRAFT_31080 [Rhodotorula sp. JG-1b]|nr:hypothetical protein RHOSPDRAFT_31080 [Rhodotorula sp. JG-1b]
MSRYNGPPRHRPEPLALGAGPHHHQQQQHPPPLYSAPLPYMSQPAYASIPQRQQQQLGPRFQATPQTANALAEFQHAQQAYLAELNRTIEHQILVQQQVEREAAYRMLALQQQQREQYGLHQATAAAQPQWQQQQQQQQAYANQYGYGVGQQQRVSLSQQQQQQQASNNPLVASALARRQRQEAAIALEQEQARAQASRRNKTTPSPPAVILSAPGEPYPDTSSSGSDSGETRPTSPESLAHATTTAAAAAVTAADGKKPPRGGDEVKAARRRSHLDALTHTVEHAEERMRRRRPVSIAGPADLVSAPNHHHQQPHHRYQSEQSHHHHQQQLSPRWPSLANQGRRHPTPPRISSDPLLSSTPLPASANATFRSHSAASASTCSSSSSATVVPPTPSALPTRVGAAPPIPGTASAIRQPRGPPTDLDAAQNNFAARIRARAIESLKGARYGRTGAAAMAAAAQEGEEFDDGSSLTTSLVGMRLTTA